METTEQNYGSGGLTPPLPPPRAPTPRPPDQKRYGKSVGPLAVLGALLLKFKVALFAIFKFLPAMFSTGGSMFISIWVYATQWGWWFAFGFVVLIFVHECGHLIAAKRLGLKVGAPVFIPFMGALIALKEAPKNAWIESQVGIGGPLLGSLGAAVCYEIGRFTGNGLFLALAYSGFAINLFNLAPFGFLDGGRIVTALSPWLWIVGSVLIVGLMVVHFNFLLLLIFIMCLPRLFSLFRKKTPEELRYFEVTPKQRLMMGSLYFGLIAFLVLGLMLSHVSVQSPQ